LLEQKKELAKDRDKIPTNKQIKKNTEINTVVRKLVNTIALEPYSSKTANVSSRLRKVRAPPLTSASPLEDDSVIARLVQHIVSYRSFFL